MKNKYYWESVGEVVSQVYAIDAESWEEAKEKAFPKMKPDDRLAEGTDEMVEKDARWPKYHYIDDQKAVKIAYLKKGAWLDDGKGGEYWDENIFYWSDDPEYLYDQDYKSIN
jgi:hypothetical protein